MHVIINALQYAQHNSGIGTLLYGLFGTWAQITRRPHTIVLPQEGMTFPASPQTRKRKVNVSSRRRLARVLYQLFFLGPHYGRNALLLATDSKFPLLLPRGCVPVPVVTDLAVYRLPETYQTSRVWLWRMQYHVVRRRAQRYVAISFFTRDELVALFGVPAERVDVVHCAPDDRYRQVTDPNALATVRARYRLPMPYIVFVGTMNPRKNLPRLLEAFDAARERGGFPHHLVLVGDTGWKTDLSPILGRMRHADAVHLTGYVANEDMPALYSQASLLAFPSLYEGFGLPIVEAQCCGTPVLTSDTASMPEVAGEGALYVDPLSVDSMTDGILRILSDVGFAEDLARRGTKNAARFSWEMAAQALDMVLEKIEKENR